MNRPVFCYEGDALKDIIISSPWFGGNVALRWLSPQIYGSPYRQFQPQTVRKWSEVERPELPLNKLSQSDRRIGIVSTQLNRSSTFDFRSTRNKESEAKPSSSSGHRSARSERLGFHPFQVNTLKSQANLVPQSTAEEDVSSSTPDIKLRSIRCRSVSFGNGVSSTSACNNNHTPTEPGFSSSSILESILLNRNIPSFYSALESSGNRVCCNSKAETSAGGSIKRPRLNSLPLPTVIPSTNIRRAHSNHSSGVRFWAAGDDTEEPLCLSSKRRKISVEEDRISENVISSARDVERKNSCGEVDSHRSSYVLRKVSSSGSILHSLLAQESSPVAMEQLSQIQLENMELSESQPEASNHNLLTTIGFVDSTDPLQNLEKLELVDKPKLISSRQQRVAISMKMQQVVNRKVSKWLAEIAQLAAKYHELTDLPREDWIVLLRNAVSRLLLLFMAEHNFQFAVVPTSEEILKSRDREEPRSTVVSAETPTAQSVDDIQRFIAKCQTLRVESREYHCMRLITLFHSGCSNGLKRIELIEQINTGACKILQDLVRLTRPDDKLRFGELLLHLHSLASVNSTMVQRLFCVTLDGRDSDYPRIDESECLI